MLDRAYIVKLAEKLTLLIGDYAEALQVINDNARRIAEMYHNGDSVDENLCELYY